MTSTRLGQLLFALYCAEAGVLFLLLPWTAGWERACFALPLPFAWRELLLGSWARGAFSGFGGIHLVWSAQEWFDWVRRRATPDAGAGG